MSTPTVTRRRTAHRFPPSPLRFRSRWWLVLLLTVVVLALAALPLVAYLFALTV
jgi:hypothetical protein